MSTRAPSIALQHLYMVRAQVDLAIATLEVSEVPAVEGCQHPEDKRVDISVMDECGPRWKCLLCDYEGAGQV